MPSFSKRNNLIPPKEILYRDELPENYRIVIFNILKEYMNLKFTWNRIEYLFNPFGINDLPRSRKSIPISKDEDYPEALATKRFCLGCQWPHLYDLAEETYKSLLFFDEENRHILEEEPTAYPFQSDLNVFFEQANVGRQMANGLIIVRNSANSEITQMHAAEILENNNLLTAAEHLHFANKALSERPEPNTNGAISHATSAIECVLGQLNGKDMTLGKHLDRGLINIHPALKKALDGVYGFASDAGPRHGKEGKKPSYEEAEFVISICAAICSFLASGAST